MRLEQEAALTAREERVKELEREGNYGAVDTAMRVLTACERLLERKGEPEPMGQSRG